MPNSIVFKNKQKLFHYTNNFQLRKFVLLMLRMNAKQVGFLFAQFLIKDAVLRVFCNNKNKLVCIFFVAISTISKCPIWQSLLPISEFVFVKKFQGNISKFSIWKTKVAFTIFHFLLIMFYFFLNECPGLYGKMGDNGGGSRNGSKIQKMGDIIYGQPLWLEVFVYHKPRNWEECSEQTRIGTW